MEWLADRFFRSNGTWVDAASGAQVRILLEPASDVDAAGLGRTVRAPLERTASRAESASGLRPGRPGPAVRGRTHAFQRSRWPFTAERTGTRQAFSVPSRDHDGRPPRCLCDARGDKPARIVVAGARSYAAAAPGAGRSSGSTRRPGRSVDGNDGCRANRGWPSHRTNVCRAIGTPRGLHSCLPRGSGETLQ